MSRLIPADIEYFLEEAGRSPSKNSGAYEAYIRTVATLLFDKYCIIKNASIEILRIPADRISNSNQD